MKDMATMEKKNWLFNYFNNNKNDISLWKRTGAKQ